VFLVLNHNVLPMMRSIAVMNQMSNAKKTTAAVNLSVGLSETGKSGELVALNPSATFLPVVPNRLPGIRTFG
jgi:hypothetical protein